MSAMLSVSLWFVLVTIVPGLVTLGAVRLAILVIAGADSPAASLFGEVDDLNLNLPVAVGAMVMTQTFGIILEERLLIPRKWLGRGGRRWERSLSPDVDPFSTPQAPAPQADAQQYQIDPYEEYPALYPMLVSLGKDEDAHGHLQRIVAQFFLTLNSMVALLIGIVAAGVLVVLEPDRALYGAIFAAALAIGVVALFDISANRFALMGWGLWSTRKRRERKFRCGQPKGTSTLAPSSQKRTDDERSVGPA